MTDKLSDQIEIGRTDIFFPVKDISINKVGRKPKLTEYKFLDAVKRTKGLSDTYIAKYLGMNRSSINRFKRNPNTKAIVEKAQIVINEIQNIRFDGRFNSFDKFAKMNSI